MTTDKDIVLAPEEVIKAKEALSRIEKNLFYRLGRYLGSKLGSQPISNLKSSSNRRRTNLPPLPPPRPARQRFSLRMGAFVVSHSYTLSYLPT